MKRGDSQPDWLRGLSNLRHLNKEGNTHERGDGMKMLPSGSAAFRDSMAHSDGDVEESVEIWTVG